MAGVTLVVGLGGEEGLTLTLLLMTTDAGRNNIEGLKVRRCDFN